MPSRGLVRLLLLSSVCSFIIVFTIYETRSASQGFIQSLSSHAQSSWARRQHRFLELDQSVFTNTTVPDSVDLSVTHRVLFSKTTYDHKYFPIVFGDNEAINPNIIPHPTLSDTWIIVAQQRRNSEQDPFRFTEIACLATFREGALRCVEQPIPLPIPATSGPHCQGDLAHLAFSVGPHDARVFYGPDAAYTIYGSNSMYTCFGQWLQDFRYLVAPWWETELLPDWGLRAPMELQRPTPYHLVEKNWFLFWDAQGHTYIHYDIYPNRAFARLNLDGSVGPDLASMSSSDEVCMVKYMPKIKIGEDASRVESLHQATNALLVTLCERNTCQPGDGNTFIATIFQHKTFHQYHSVYEPYLMLFRRQPPFSIYAISKKPFWISGRGRPGETRPLYLPLKPTDPWNQTQMLYVTSMSWRTQGQKYHGYIDDGLFLTFGVEDEQSGGIDIVAGDLLQHLGFCEGD